MDRLRLHAGVGVVRINANSSRQVMEGHSSSGPTSADAWQPLFEKYPGRRQHIKTLATLLDPTLAPPRNIVVHGTEATGKTAVTVAVLQTLGSRTLLDGAAASTEPNGLQENLTDHAIVDSNKCVTARHLFERTVAQVAAGVRYSGPPSRRCETLAQLTVELTKILQHGDHPPNWRFVLVFDAIDRQRDAPATLLPGLARLSEIIPNLTTIFVVTLPTPSMLRTSAAPHIHFANYTKAEFVQILGHTPPTTLANATEQETAELWTRYCGAVHDALTRTAGRMLSQFREACTALWPKFTAPVRAGTHGPREFSKLLIAARAHFQDELLLDPSFVVGAAAAEPRAEAKTTDTATTTTPEAPVARHLATLLPTAARLFLLCAYLASHNAPKHDLTLFSTYHHGRKRRRGGGGLAGTGAGAGRRGPRSKHRKIARKLLGAHTFPLERLLAIFAAVRGEWTRAPPVAAAASATGALVDGDAYTALATLAALRLVVRVAGPGSDPVDRGAKWRVNVGWEVVRSLGRSMGVEMEDWLID